MELRLLLWITLHSTSVCFATRAIARGAAIITDNLEGGNVDEVDGAVNNDVALQSSFENLDFRLRFWIGWPLSNPLPSWIDSQIFV